MRDKDMLISAQEAYTKVMTMKINKISKERKEIFNKIKICIDKGQMDTFFNYTIPIEIKKELEALGYKVKYNNIFNDSETFVSWDLGKDIYLIKVEKEPLIK